MHNYVYLIGRIAEIGGGFDNNIIVKIAVQRTEKNDNGIYETDFFKCVIPNSLSRNCMEYLRKGDLIGIRGCLRTDTLNDIKIVVDKCTFLSSGKESD
jgi:single-stranded DNA-binding protein